MARKKALRLEVEQAGVLFDAVQKFWIEKFPVEELQAHVKYALEEHQEFLDALSAFHGRTLPLKRFKGRAKLLEEVRKEAADAIITVLVPAAGLGVPGSDIARAIAEKMEMMRTRDYVWNPIHEYYVRRDKLSKEELEEIKQYEEAKKQAGGVV